MTLHVRDTSTRGSFTLLGAKADQLGSRSCSPWALCVLPVVHAAKRGRTRKKGFLSRSVDTGYSDVRLQPGACLGIKRMWMSPKISCAGPNEGPCQGHWLAQRVQLLRQPLAGDRLVIRTLVQSFFTCRCGIPPCQAVNCRPTLRLEEHPRKCQHWHHNAVFSRTPVWSDLEMRVQTRREKTLVGSSHASGHDLRPHMVCTRGYEGAPIVRAGNPMSEDHDKQGGLRRRRRPTFLSKRRGETFFDEPLSCLGVFGIVSSCPAPSFFMRVGSGGRWAMTWRKGRLGREGVDA